MRLSKAATGAMEAVIEQESDEAFRARIFATWGLQLPRLPALPMLPFSFDPFDLGFIDRLQQPTGYNGIPVSSPLESRARQLCAAMVETGGITKEQAMPSALARAALQLAEEERAAKATEDGRIAALMAKPGDTERPPPTEKRHASDWDCWATSGWES